MANVVQMIPESNADAARNRTVRLLAFLVFVSCAVSAFCLGTLAFNFTTGDLPFGIKAMLTEPKINNAEEGQQQVAEEETKQRSGERHALALFKQLTGERAKLADEREKLAERKRAVEEINTGVRKMQGELQVREERIWKLLTFIDKQEVANIKRLTALIAQIEPKAGAEMLLEMNNSDPEVVARMLYVMDTKAAATVLSGMMKNGGGKAVTDVAEIARKYRLYARESDETDALKPRKAQL